MMFHLNKRPAYVRMFLFLSFCSAAIILLFSFILIRHFTDSARAEVNRYTEETLEKSVNQTEYTLNRLKMLSLRIYQDGNIQNWLLAKEDNIFKLNAARKSSDDYRAIEPFIHSVCMFNDYLQHADCSDEGASYEYFSDPTLLRQARAAFSGYLQFRNLSTLDNAGRPQSQYLMLKVSSTPYWLLNSGNLIVLVDKFKLQQYLLNFDTPNQNRVKQIVVDDTGTKILGDDIFKDDKELRRFVTDMHDKDHSTWKSGGNTWLVSSRTISSEDWKLYQLTSTELWDEQTREINRLILIVAVCMLLLILVIAYWTSLRNMKPLQELIAKIQQKIGFEGEYSNEYEAINRSIDSLVDQINDQNRSIRSQDAIIKEEYLRQWVLSGKLISPLQEYFKKNTGLLHKGSLVMAVIRIDNYAPFSEINNFASRKLLKFGMANIALETSQQHGYAGETADFGSDHILLLLPVSRGDPIGDTMFKEIEQHILTWLHIPVVFAVSETIPCEDNLSAPYKQTVECSMLKFLTGTGKIYRKSDYESYINQVSNAFVPGDLLQALIREVNLRNAEGMRKSLAVIFAKLKELPYQQCALELTHIVYELVRGFQRFADRFGTIRDEIPAFDTLQQSQDWLERIMLDIIDNLEQAKLSSRNEALTTDIIEYIKNNIHDPMMTLESVAEHVNLSPDYVRKTFKKCYDVSLSDFILNERIALVKRLLVSTKWSIDEILGQTGFLSRSSFFTAFKKLTGMTPNRFRQEKGPASDESMY